MPLGPYDRGPHNAPRRASRSLFPGGNEPVASRLFLGAAAAGALASAACAMLHGAQPPPPSSPRLLLPGSVFELPRDITASAWAVQAALLLATAPALDHLAAALPRCFTPGEAGILLQALLALAAGSAAYLAGGVRQGLLHVLWSPHVGQPDPGMHVPAFCMLVLFWVLFLAACSAVAAGARRGNAQWQQPEPAAGGVAGATASGASAKADGDDGAVADGRRPCTATAEGLHRRHHSANNSAADPRAKLVPAVSSPSQPYRKGIEVPAVCAAAVCGAAVSFFMLVELALWVLRRFVAASSRPRLATLAYWFSCLAVTVPLMYAVSKASAAREQERQRKGDRAKGPERRAQQEWEADAQQEWERCSGGSGKLNPKRLVQQGPARECAVEGAGSVDGTEAASGNQGGSAAQRAAPGSAATDGVAEGLSGRSADAAGECAAGPDDKKGLAAPPAGTRRRRASYLGSAFLRLLAIPHIVMRKGYHLLAILLFLPAFGWDVRMLQASLAVAGAVLVFTEVLRCVGPASVRSAIGGFMADFADARDSGPVYVTHFTLLLGIAVPVWLSESVCGAAAGAMMAGLYGDEAAEPMPAPPGAPGPRLSAAAARLLPSCRTVVGLSGLVALGSGDTAAACIGFLLGRLRLFRGGKKTLEGTLSGAAAMMGSWAMVVWWMDVGWALGWRTWVSLALTTGGVALLEAVTAQLDNVVVPLYYLTHLVLVMTGS